MPPLTILVGAVVSGEAAGEFGARRTRAWVDFDGDGRQDFCRLIRQTPTKLDEQPEDLDHYSAVVVLDTTRAGDRIACTVTAGARFTDMYKGPTISVGVQPGISHFAWVDVNGDARVDFCGWQAIGTDKPDTDATRGHVVCYLADARRWQAARTSLGTFVLGRFPDWVDVDADGRADLCRFVLTGPRTSPSCVQPTAADLVKCAEEARNLDVRPVCHPAGRSFFGLPPRMGAPEKFSAVGLPRWLDVDGDRRADLCRFDPEGEFVRCTLSTADGFGDEFVDVTARPISFR